MWCSKCKWLATSEEPHTKNYHHHFTKLGWVNYNNKKPHPASQMMKKMGQAPSKKNKVWAICELDVDPCASVSKKATTGRRGHGKSFPPSTDASSKDQSNSRQSKSMPPPNQDHSTSNKKKSQDVGSIVSTKRVRTRMSRSKLPLLVTSSITPPPSRNARGVLLTSLKETQYLALLRRARLPPSHLVGRGVRLRRMLRTSTIIATMAVRS